MITVFAVWLGNAVYTARQQEEAVSLYMRLGGRFIYDYQVNKAGKLTPNAKPHGWEWLRGSMGADYFDSVQTLDLRKTEVADGDLSQLANLRGLRELRLDGTAVTDNGMQYLLDLRSLDAVSLNGTHVTEKGVNRLVETGKQVYCVLGTRIAAVDELGKPRTVLFVGEEIALHGTFYVPLGAKLDSKPPFVVSIVARPPGGARVIMQQGFVRPVQTSRTRYELRTVLHLKSSRTTAIPGQLEVGLSGVNVCVEPLLELRPAQRGPFGPPVFFDP